MNGYFYHGIEFYPGCVGETIQLLIKILDEGIILRSKARKYKNESLDHICLYKKNEDYDYNSNLALIHSARGGWIDGQFVFIINQNNDEEEEKDKVIVKQNLPILIEKAQSMGLAIEDSEQPSFTDDYDNNYSDRVL